MDIDLQWLGWAFTTTNALRALFCLPQVIAVARSPDGARSIALSTWWMWTLNNALGAAYAATQLHDTAMAWSFAGSIVGCLATLALTIFKRRAHRRKLRREAARQRDASRLDMMIDGLVR